MAFGTEILPETRFKIKGSKTLFQSAVEGRFGNARQCGDLSDGILTRMIERGCFFQGSRVCFRSASEPSSCAGGDKTFVGSLDERFALKGGKAGNDGEEQSARCGRGIEALLQRDQADSFFVE